MPVNVVDASDNLSNQLMCQTSQVLKKGIFYFIMDDFKSRKLREKLETAATKLV